MEENKEIWAPCINFDNYEISSFGKVRNKNTGHLLKIRFDLGNKFGQVRLNKKGQKYWKSVRILVAETFLGYRKEDPLTSVSLKNLNAGELSNEVSNIIVDKFYSNNKKIGFYTVKDSFKSECGRYTKILGECEHGKTFELHRGQLYNRCSCYLTEKYALSDLIKLKVPLHKYKGMYWFDYLISTSKSNSNSRVGLRKEHNITNDYIIDLYLKQKGLSPYFNIPIDLTFKDKLRRASIDRIDNSKGYIKGNVVLCTLFENKGRGEIKFKNFNIFCKDLINK